MACIGVYGKFNKAPIPILTTKPKTTADIPAAVKYVRCSIRLTLPNIRTVYRNIRRYPETILTPSKNMALELRSLKLQRDKEKMASS